MRDYLWIFPNMGGPKNPKFKKSALKSPSNPPKNKKKSQNHPKKLFWRRGLQKGGDDDEDNDIDLEALLSQLLVVLAKSVTVASPMVGNYPPTNLIVMVMVIVIVMVMVMSEAKKEEVVKPTLMCTSMTFACQTTWKVKLAPNKYKNNLTRKREANKYKTMLMMKLEANEKIRSTRQPEIWKWDQT